MEDFQPGNPQSTANLWTRILSLLRDRVSEDTFQRWFELTNLSRFDDDVLILSIPNEIYRFWIEENHMPALQDAVIQLLGTPRSIKFVLNSIISDKKIPGASPAGKTAPIESVSEIPAEEPAEERLGDSPAKNALSKSQLRANLNNRYLFDSFVVGSNSRFVQAAASAVADKPSRIYNPFFVHGGPGLGKTHIIQAIGNQVLATRKNARVLYVSSETFANDFIDAIQKGEMVKFRKRYRQVDVLLIDDIQFLGGKDKTQEEFFHTFNALFDGHKQIVLSSDRPPSEIRHLESRLVSRFEWGLTAEVHPPDAETRIAILRKKMQLWDVKLEDEVVFFLADRIHNNIRRLEGALMRTASFASLSGTKLTLQRAEELLRDILHEEAKNTITFDQIQKRVAEHFDIRIADMTSKRRPASIAFPRQIAMFLSRQMLKASYSEIGDAFGGRDHGTVMHAYRQIQKKMKADDELRRAVSLLESMIRSNRDA
ncbi:MAG: chromosomal replication initiator protein [Verrucomicrobiales bacterium]|jgi:chromosomal replication initiator protein